MGGLFGGGSAPPPPTVVATPPLPTMNTQAVQQAQLSQVQLAEAASGRASTIMSSGTNPANNKLGG
jgi:hypothetical protein